MTQELRINQVRIATAARVVVISWDARQQLLERVRQLHGGAELIERFDAVGTSQPAKLNRAGKQLVLETIYGWTEQVGVDELPEGITELRYALLNDLSSTEPLNSAGGDPRSP
jgi:hypothetical protein